MSRWRMGAILHALAWVELLLDDFRCRRGRRDPTRITRSSPTCVRRQRDARAWWSLLHTAWGPKLFQVAFPYTQMLNHGSMEAPPDAPDSFGRSVPARWLNRTVLGAG